MTLVAGSEKAFLESIVVLMNPDPSITISCDGELVVFSDDANSSPTQSEIVARIRLVPAAGSAIPMAKGAIFKRTPSMVLVKSRAVAEFRFCFSIIN